MIQRRNLLKGSVLLLLLQQQHIVYGASIVAVRMWPADDYTRITLESDTTLSAEYLIIENPLRMIIDIQGLQLNEALQNLAAKPIEKDPYINKIRVAQNAPSVVRIVLDLKQNIKPQIFSLDPISPYQNRLVFDLYPEKELDPLASLLASITTTTDSAEPDDPLGNLINQINQPTIKQAEDPIGGILDGIKQQNTPKIEAPPNKHVPPVKPQPTKPITKPVIQPQQKNLNNLIIVAIDPGHGGEDPGAIGPRKTREKDVVLQMALKLRNTINQKRNMRAILTRDADFFVPLDTRVKKARRLQADLFVSIHADAFTKPSANGISVFVLSTRGASSTTAKFLATKENQSDLIGGANIKNKSQQVSKMLLEYSTDAQIKQSAQLGSLLLNQLQHVGRLHNKVIERANFAVLRSPDVPSVLVETGFISNPKEEQNLRTAVYQNKIVKAIATGVIQYFTKFPTTRKNRKV